MVEHSDSRLDEASIKRDTTLDRLRRIVGDTTQPVAERDTSRGSMLAQIGVPRSKASVIELLPKADTKFSRMPMATFSACLSVENAQGAMQVWVSNRDSTFPSGLFALDQNSNQKLWIHPPNHHAALWACEQSARCRGVGAVFADVPRTDGTAFRRLKLAAEVGGGLVVLWRLASSERETTFADARLRVGIVEQDVASSTVKSPLSYRPQLRIDVLYQRGLAERRSFLLSWNDFDDPVPVVSELADSTSPQRTDRKPAQRKRKPRRRKRLGRVG